MNWFTSMFSSTTSSDDIIGAGTLNATKITAILAAITTGILAIWPTITDTDGPLGSLTGGQKLTLFLGAAALIVVLVMTDMLTRAYVTGKANQAVVHWLDPAQAASCLDAGEWVSGSLIGWNNEGKVFFVPKTDGAGPGTIKVVDLKEIQIHY